MSKIYLNKSFVILISDYNSVLQSRNDLILISHLKLHLLLISKKKKPT